MCSAPPFLLLQVNGIFLPPQSSVLFLFSTLSTRTLYGFDKPVTIPLICALLFLSITDGSFSVVPSLPFILRYPFLLGFCGPVPVFAHESFWSPRPFALEFLATFFTRAAGRNIFFTFPIAPICSPRRSSDLFAPFLFLCEPLSIQDLIFRLGPLFPPIFSPVRSRRPSFLFFVFPPPPT